MRKNLNGILNGVYGLLCFGLFLVQNGYIVFPGTIENGLFTNEFYPILQVVQLVFAAVGVAVVVSSAWRKGWTGLPGMAVSRL